MDKERNKTGGRQKGTANKASSQLRGMITDFLHENWQQVEEDFKDPKLHPRDRLAFIEKLLKFAIPTLASTDATVELKSQLESLSEEDLDKVVGMIVGQSAGEPAETEEE